MLRHPLTFLGFVVLTLLLSSCGYSSEPPPNVATIKVAEPTTMTPRPTLLSGACGTIGFPVGTTGTIVVRNGEIGCADANQLIDRYFRDDSLVRTGNTQAAEFDRWLCVSPTATAAEVEGYGARCTRESDGADIVVTTTDAATSPAERCSPDKIAADIGRPPAGGVRCQGDWAYVDWGDMGDSQALLRSIDGVWKSFSGFPSALCVDEARAQGVPDAELSNFAPCVRAAPSAPTGDLGLPTPITVPACDGHGIVVLHSATAPGQYESEVSAALSKRPGAHYLRTDRSCPSLRQQSNEGNPIYAVYRPAGRTITDLCAAVNQQGGGAYGKWLDTTSDPMAIVPC